MGISQVIKRKNVKFDVEAKRLTQLFDENGIFTVILKGQGNELLYPVRGCRIPGDIDIFVDGGKEFVVDWIDRHGLADRAEKATYHHVHLLPGASGMSTKKTGERQRESAENRFLQVLRAIIPESARNQKTRYAMRKWLGQ